MGINDGPVYVYYDRQKGWEGTNPGWYEVILHIEEPRETVIRFTDMVDWIEENIHGYKKHCRWIYAGNYLKFKFRHEKDYLWFKLRWG
jgi:hypothetical protein